MAAYTCSIVVPVRNEAATLARTVPALLDASEGENPRIVWVTNGCDDDSAARLRRLAGPLAEVIELERPGKTGALQVGDNALGDLFPRVYLDADTWLGRGDLTRLLRPLRDGRADLTAARCAFDYTGASVAAAAMARCWSALPHAQENAYHRAIGVSAAGRARWGRWPDILGDDIFATAMTPADRRQIVDDAVATTWAPPTFAAWVRTRRRWLVGEWQLRRLGLLAPATAGQRSALLRRLAAPREAPGAALFLAARMLGGISASRKRCPGWTPERPADLAAAQRIQASLRHGAIRRDQPREQSP